MEREKCTWFSSLDICQITKLHKGRGWRAAKKEAQTGRAEFLEIHRAKEAKIGVQE